MPQRLRKIRKYRGSRTYGWGQVSQHRGRGSRGGSGYSGGHKHRWTHYVKFDPDHYGRHGFKNPNTIERMIINVGYLDEISLSLLKRGFAKMEDGIITINLADIGIGKVLGSGKVNKPFIVKVKEFTESASKKIEDAGGKILKLS